MLKYNNINNVSDKLLSEIPPMPDEVVVQMLNGTKNMDNDINAREKQPMLFGKTQLPTYAKIKDPYGNGGRGAIVAIGVPERVVNGNAESYYPYLAGQFEESIFNGKFSLFKGNIKDEELYEMWSLVNENESNPNRDKTVKPLFKFLNKREEAQASVKRVDILMKALDDLKTITSEEIEEFAASMNWSETDPDSLKGMINEYGRTNPDKYLTIRKDPVTPLKSTVKKAIGKEILTIDYNTGNVMLLESTLFTISKDGLKDHLDAIAKWVNASRNGKEVLASIEKQLGATEKEKKVAKKKEQAVVE